MTKTFLKVFILFCTFSLYASESVVIKNRAYIYRSPDPLEKSRSYLVRGDLITLTSSEFDNYISFTFKNNKTGKVAEGWVRVTDIQLSNSISSSTFNSTRVIARSGLRLRKAPHLRSRIILTIPYGKTVLILSENGPEGVYRKIKSRWIKVRYRKFIGWVFGGYLEKFRIEGFDTTKDTLEDEKQTYDPSLYDYDPNVDDQYYDMESYPNQPIDNYENLNEEEIFQ